MGPRLCTAATRVLKFVSAVMSRPPDQPRHVAIAGSPSNTVPSSETAAYHSGQSCEAGPDEQKHRGGRCGRRHAGLARCIVRRRRQVPRKALQLHAAGRWSRPSHEGDVVTLEIARGRDRGRHRRGVRRSERSCQRHRHDASNDQPPHHATSSRSLRLTLAGMRKKQGLFQGRKTLAERRLTRCREPRSGMDVNIVDGRASKAALSDFFTLRRYAADTRP